MDSSLKSLFTLSAPDTHSPDSMKYFVIASISFDNTVMKVHQIKLCFPFNPHSDVL